MRQPARDAVVAQQLGERRGVRRGTIDFARIIARAAQAGIQHYQYFVEHDNTSDPIASIRASYAHLRGL